MPLHERALPPGSEARLIQRAGLLVVILAILTPPVTAQVSAGHDYYLNTDGTLSESPSAQAHYRGLSGPNAPHAPKDLGGSLTNTA